MPYDAMSEMGEDDLLAAYASGDAAAARALNARFTPKVFAHAMRMLNGNRAEAEDVTQEAMLRLWRAAPKWRTGEAKVSTWLYRVVANLCIDRIRKARGTVDIDSVAEPVDDTPSAAQNMVQKARMHALQDALGTLPERQKQAVILRHIEGMSNPEIGKIMDLGTRAVESLTARGKRALEAVLAKRRGELGFEGDD